MTDTTRTGYLRMPTIHGDWIVFTAEDDLWRVRIPAGPSSPTPQLPSSARDTSPAADTPLPAGRRAGGEDSSGRAERLTAGVAEATDARVSPDGTRIAFTGCDEGPNEVYVMPAAGGPATRLTYLGGETQVVGWRDDHTIIFRSNSGQPMREWMTLFAVSPTGGEPRPLGLGVAHSIAWGPNGAAVLGRHTIEDRLHWKGYRGGLGGQLWVDASGTGTFTRILTVLDGHITSPCWVGDRIYFLSDHEGVARTATANVYSCLPDGGALHRHTHHTRHYARNLSTDGHRLVFQSAGDLYLLEPGAFSSTKLDIELPGPRQQRARKFVLAAGYLDREGRTADPHPDGRHIALIARGKLLAIDPTRGVVIQLGDPDGTRYRLPTWLPDGRRLVAIADPSGHGYAEPRLVELTADGTTPPRPLAGPNIGPDIGRVLDLVPSPDGDRIALANHRGELIVVDLESGSSRILDQNAFDPIRGMAWSPDGTVLAYGYPLDAQRTAIKLRRIATGETCLASAPLSHDTDPAFDPDGDYLYFLGARDFNQAIGGGAGAARPYAVALRRGIGSPFVSMPQPFGDDPATSDASVPRADTPDLAHGADDHARAGAAIHAGGITERAAAFPVAPGAYGRVAGIPGGVVYSREGGLHIYDFARQREATILEDSVDDFTVTPGGTILVHGDDGLLLVTLDDRIEADDTAARAARTLRLDRVAVSVHPHPEWRQMYFEAWRLQRDYFWRADMNGVPWAAMRDRYAPLLERIASRGDLADLIWELQGELRASHAFALGGDYRQEAGSSGQGCLGVDWSHAYDPATGGYRITRFARGDPWNAGAAATNPLPGNILRASSPLLAPGLEIRARDTLLAVDGQPVTPAIGPGQLLVNKAGRAVDLVIRSAVGGARRRVTVRALHPAEDRGARYRDWVEANRRHVAAATAARVGYIHIPDMVGDRTGAGYAEFWRAYTTEFDREALILDVRWNNGGNISPNLLDWLTRRRVGEFARQHGVPDPLPRYSPRGPMVALINELTASDGEIFSHGFRALNLGPLVGARTWGGVIAITPERYLTDTTNPTQPQYGACFIDVGCDIENHGVDPVRDPVRDRANQVDITPQDYHRGVDPQLDRAIAEALHQIAVRTMRTPLPDASIPNQDDRLAG